MSSPPSSSSHSDPHAGDSRAHTPPFTPIAHPELDHSLSADLCVHRFDVRYPPRENIPPHVLQAYGPRVAVMVPATETAPELPATYLRLISKALPWTIDVQHTRSGYFGVGQGEPDGKPITCDYLWRKIHEALLQPLTHAEWALIADNEGDEKVDAMKAAAEARKAEGGDATLVVRRVDYLGDKTIFRGLKKSDELAEKRLLPGEEAYPGVQTWVLKFAARS